MLSDDFITAIVNPLERKPLCIGQNIQKCWIVLPVNVDSNTWWKLLSFWTDHDLKKLFLFLFSSSLGLDTLTPYHFTCRNSLLAKNLPIQMFLIKIWYSWIKQELKKNKGYNFIQLNCTLLPSKLFASNKKLW